MTPRSRIDRIVEYLATESVRISAILRVPLIGLIVALGPIADVDPWLPAVYSGLLGCYAGAAVVWLIVVLRGPVRPWAGWVSTGIDVLAVLALCLSSGGATSLLLPVFFLLPISVAFQNRPELTAFLGIGTAVGYLSVWIVYSKRDDTVGLPNVVYLYFGFLLWLAAATTGLCLVLARRSTRVAALLDVRRRLVSESVQADERHNRELAEHLHDGPLQNLLAARLDLEEVRERSPDPALDAVDAAIQETAKQLRSTVTALHPQVLAQLGLTAATRELVRQYAERADFEIVAELAEVGRPASQSLLYRAVRELLANAHKHARATLVDVRLAATPDAITLTVTDDGTGFDTSTLDRCVADGHIGLASLLVRIDAMGGDVDLDSEIGRGTTISIVMPTDAADL